MELLIMGLSKTTLWLLKELLLGMGTEINIKAKFKVIKNMEQESTGALSNLKNQMQILLRPTMKAHFKVTSDKARELTKYKINKLIKNF